MEKQFMELGKIAEVKGLFHKELPRELAAVDFEFERGHLLISVDENDDSIVLTTYTGNFPLNIDEYHIRPFLKDDMMQEIKEKRIQWIWELTNQQGYTDGIQLEFTHSRQERLLTIQFIAIASRLEQRIVEKCQNIGCK